LKTHLGAFVAATVEEIVVPQGELRLISIVFSFSQHLGIHVKRRLAEKISPPARRLRVVEALGGMLCFQTAAEKTKRRFDPALHM